MRSRIAACAALIAVFSAPQLAAAANTTVRMVTTLGTIDIELYDDQTPITVTNFLRYAGSGRYTNNGFIHRHATIQSSGVSVIQGGGYEWYYFFQGASLVRHIQTSPPIKNEFSPLRSNVRGRIAMAKTADPDSATSEWFINLDNNSAALDDPNNSGGFTVFGQVLGTGMTVVDAIANLTVQPTYLWESPYTPQPTLPFSELPVINTFDPTTDFDLSGKLVQVTSIPNVAAMYTPLNTWTIFTSDVDMTFTPGSFGAFSASYSASLLATFTPPPGKTVQFNDGISTFKLTGTMSPTGLIVTLFHGSATTPNHYYAYGPTADNATPHWYDFTYDGTTGAEIVGNKILLHFVDNQRGDDDFTTDGSITHTGAPVLVTDIPASSPTSVGCSIAATPSSMRNGGDWIVVSMFLAFVALVRRRIRRNRI